MGRILKNMSGKLYKRIAAGIVGVLIGVILAVTAFGNLISVKADNTVSLVINVKPKAEVALAVGNTKINYADFQDDLAAALEEKGIGSDCVSFVEVDANASTSQNSFTWWTYDHSTTRNVNQSNNKYIEYTYDNSQSTNSYNGLANHISVTNSGATMDFYGYGSSGYKDFNYMPNTQATKKTIEFTVAEGSAYDALDGIGFLVNCSITGTYSSSQYLNGYLVFLQYSNAGVGTYIKLYKLTNVNTYYLHHNSSGYTFDYSNISGVSLLATASTTYGDYDYRKFKIEVMPEYIKIWYNGSSYNNSNLTLTDSHLVKWPGGATQYTLTPGYDTVSGVETYRGGYGPLISYRSHGCDQLTHFTLSNLKMTAEYVRSLTEVVREPSWTEDKVSFLVNLNEAPIEDFSDEFSTAEIINRLQDENVSYIGWCGTKNYTDSMQFVNGVGNDSALVNMNDTTLFGTDPYSTDSYNKQIQAIADIIFNKICKETETDGVHTFLNTDGFQFQALNASLSDGNWSVGYSSESFELASDNVSTYQNLENASFLQSGYYEVYYDSNYQYPKARIRIHQAPIALLNANLTNGTIDVSNKSYDPEFCSDASVADGGIDSGIAESVIEYRNLSSDAPEWTTTAPDNVSDGDTWLVRLTVTDADGASASTVCQVSANATQTAPYGTFKMSSNQYIKGIDENIQIIDQSYTLDGSTDFTVSYVIKNSSGTAVWTSSQTVGNANYFAPNTTYTYALSNLSVGTYTVTMTAKKGTKTSEAVSRTFSVVQGYKITYDANGGTGAPATQYKIYNQSLTLSNIAPNKAGYTFGGWLNGTTVYNPGQVYTGNAALNLVAVWNKNMTYEATGYSGIYDGHPHGISVVIEDPADDYTIKYGTSSSSCNKDSITYTIPGTYTVYFTITKSGYQTVTNSRTVYIDKATPVLTISNKVVSYNGQPCTIDDALINSAPNLTTGELVYTYYTDAACTTLTTGESCGASYAGAAPVEKGVYYVKASFPGDARFYEAESNIATLTIEKYTVTFDMGGYGVAPSDITDVVYGTTVNEPATVPTSETHMFIGWYKDSDLETVWDFDNDKVYGNTTIYAKWKAKDSYDVRYYDEDGNPYYGTLDEALESGSRKIVIQNDITVDNVVIHEETDVEIESDATVTVEGPLEIDGTLDNDGNIVNKSQITGDGKITNDGIIYNTDGEIGDADSDLEIENNGKIIGGKLTGKITNKGEIDECTLGEDSTLKNKETGKVTDSDLNGDTENEGEIDGSTFGEDSTLKNKESGKVTDSDLNGDTENEGEIDNSTFGEDSTLKNKESGKVTDSDLNGDTENEGEIDNSTFGEDSTLKNKETGKVTDSDLNGDTENEGEIDNSTFGEDSTLKNKETGKVTDSVLNGDTENEGEIDNSTFGEDSTLKNKEGGKVTDSDLNGDTENEGEIDGSTFGEDSILKNKETGKVTDSDLNGDAENEGEIDNSTFGEDSTLKNKETGKVTDSDLNGDTENEGEIDNSTFGEDSTLKNKESGKVTDSDLNGDTENEGEIDNSTFGEDSTLKNKEGGKVTDSDLNGDTENEGEIDNSTFGEDSTLKNKEGGKVTDSDLNGDTENEGEIDNSTFGEDSTLKNKETGKVTDSDLNGDTENEGEIDGSTFGEDSTLKNKESGKVTDSDLNGDTENEGEIDGSTFGEDSTLKNKEGGKVTDSDLNGDTENEGEIDGSTFGEDSTLKNKESGKVTDSDLNGDTENESEIDNSTFGEDSTLKNKETGKVTDSDLNGDTENEGEIDNSTFGEDSTLKNKESGKVTDSDLNGDTENEGEIDECTLGEDGTLKNKEGGKVTDSDLNGDTENEGEIDGSTFGEDSTLKNKEGGKVTDSDLNGKVTNKGNLTDNIINGDVDNSAGVITGGTIGTKGLVSGGLIDGTVANNGTITGSTIKGTLKNDGTIKESTIAGYIDNEAGTIIGGIVTADGSVIKGVIEGNVTNYGIIQLSIVKGEINNEGGEVEEWKVTVEDDDKEPFEKKEVAFGSGNIQIIMDVVDENNEKSSLVMMLSDGEKIINACLTPEEIQKVWNGVYAIIKVFTIDILDSIPDNEDALVEDAIKSDERKLEFGTYLDITIKKKIGSADWEKLSQLNGEIEIVIDIPKEILYENAKYYVIRLHNGECTVLDDLDDNQNTITIATDMFSVYAIVYEKEEVIVEPETIPETEPENNTVQESKCRLCHFCMQPLGICMFIWIAIVVAIIIVVVTVVLIVKFRKNKD